MMISASAAPLLRLIRRVDISPGSVSILLDRNAFAACLSMGPERIREDALRIHAPFRLRRRGVETKLVLGNPTKSVDRTLLRNIANALSWLDRIKAGKTYEEIATEDAIPTDRVRKAIRYAFLAPDIVRAIVEGRQPVGLTSSYLLHHPLPDDWEETASARQNAVSLQRPLVLPPLSVGKMTLRLYGALNYSHGLSKGPSFGTGRDAYVLPTVNSASTVL